MPLCHVIGRTYTEKIFNIIYTFLNRERKETYNLITYYLKIIFQEKLPGKKPIILKIDKKVVLKNALY